MRKRWDVVRGQRSAGAGRRSDSDAVAGDDYETASYSVLGQRLEVTPERRGCLCDGHPVELGNHYAAALCRWESERAREVLVHCDDNQLLPDRPFEDRFVGCTGQFSMFSVED